MFSQRRSGRVLRIVAMLLAVVSLCLMALPRQALADDYSIDQVVIDATIATDGSVSVTESREFDFDGSFHGVYWKIPTGSYEGQQIETTIDAVGEIINGSFVAFEEDYSGANHTYQISDYGSYVQVKLYSAHDYESATFVIGYTDTNLAVRYDDISVLYWKFVSDGWDVTSHNVSCTVHLPVPDGKQVTPEENVRAWGHGPLDATVSFDGNDVVYWVPGVGTSEFAEARITFPDDWLSEATSRGGARLQQILSEEQAWADEANARRERARIATYGGSLLSLLGTLVTFVVSTISFVRYRRSHKPTFDDKYFRDVPSDDHPAVLGALWRGGTPEGEDFTGTLMHLTDLGAVSLELVTIEDKGFLGRAKTRKDYRLSATNKAADMKLSAIDRGAMLVLFDKIGRFTPGYDHDNASICFGDLEKVAKKKPERYHNAFEGWNAKVESAISSRRFFKSDRPTGRAAAVACATGAIALCMGTIFLMLWTEAWTLCIPLILFQVVSIVLSFVFAAKMEPISDEAIELRAKLEALRNWLQDFTRLEEAVPRDVVLWNRLLVMAVVLGVADEVIKQLKTVMPDILEDPRIMPTYAWYYGVPDNRPYRSFNTSYDSAHHVSESKLASSSSSSGGGGGGGFSGGGGGGFGGGGGGGAF